MPLNSDVTGPYLTIKQPWAWLIVREDITDGAERAMLRAADIIKPVENRDWHTFIRGWIGIHAGKTIDEGAYSWCKRNLPEVKLPPPHALLKGGVVGRAHLIDCVTSHPSRFFMGKYAFVFDASEPLPYRPCRGMLGFFKPVLTE